MKSLLEKISTLSVHLRIGENYRCLLMSLHIGSSMADAESVARSLIMAINQSANVRRIVVSLRDLVLAERMPTGENGERRGVVAYFSKCTLTFR